MVNKNKKLLFLIIVLIVMAGCATTYAVVHRHSVELTKSGPIKTTDSKQNTPTSNVSANNNQTKSATSAKTSAAGKNTDAPAVGSDLTSPSGNFVSSHAISLDTSNEESVCLTSPNASCTITFTKGGVSKTLTSQVADDTGSTMWHWNAKDSGLTSGSWHITATASLHGQTKTTTDLQDLVIQ